MIFGLITPYSIHFPSIRMSVPWQIQVIKRSALSAVTNDLQNSLIKAFVLSLKLRANGCNNSQHCWEQLCPVISLGGEVRPGPSYPDPV